MPENGIEFTRRIPEGAKFERWNIFRVKGKREFKGIILGHDVTCVRVHFYGGRSYPHLEANCRACADNNRYDWKGYIAATDYTLQERWILELLPNVIDRFDQEFRNRRTLRALRAAVKRNNGADNGKCIAAFAEPQIPAANLPAACVVEQVLHRTWGIVYVEPTPLLKQIQKPRLATGTDDATPHLD